MLVRSLIILITALALSPQQASAQQKLRWKLEANEDIKYRVEQKMTTSRKIGEQEIKQTMDQSMDMEWNVQSKTTTNATVMNQVVKRIRLISEGGPAGTINFDTNSKTKPENPIIASMADTFQKIVNQPFSVTMRPTGEIENVRVPPKLIEAIRQSAAGNPAALNEETLQQMMKQSAVTLPKEAVKPGSTWTSDQSVQLPFGTMNINSNMRYTENDQKNAVISVVPQISVTPKEGAPIKMSLSSSTGEGRVLFDIDKGRVTESRLHLTLAMKIETAQGQVFHQTIEQTTTMTLVP